MIEKGKRVIVVGVEFPGSLTGKQGVVVEVGVSENSPKEPTATVLFDEGYTKTVWQSVLEVIK